MSPPSSNLPGLPGPLPGPEALHAAYVQHVAVVRAAIQLFGLPADLADEVTLETFVMAHGRGEDLRTPALAKARLCTLALRVTDSFRDEVPADAPPVAYSVPGGTVLSVFLEGLKDRRREMFVLAELGGLRVPELSAELGIGFDDVRTTLVDLLRDFAVTTANAEAEEVLPLWIEANKPDPTTLQRNWHRVLRRVAPELVTQRMPTPPPGSWGSPAGFAPAPPAPPEPTPEPARAAPAPGSLLASITDDVATVEEAAPLPAFVIPVPSASPSAPVPPVSPQIVAPPAPPHSPFASPPHSPFAPQPFAQPPPHSPFAPPHSPFAPRPPAPPVLGPPQTPQPPVLGQPPAPHPPGPPVLGQPPPHAPQPPGQPPPHAPQPPGPPAPPFAGPAQPFAPQPPPYPDPAQQPFAPQQPPFAAHPGYPPQPDLAHPPPLIVSPAPPRRSGSFSDETLGVPPAHDISFAGATLDVPAARGHTFTNEAPSRTFDDRPEHRRRSSPLVWFIPLLLVLGAGGVALWWFVLRPQEPAEEVAQNDVETPPETPPLDTPLATPPVDPTTPTVDPTLPPTKTPETKTPTTKKPGTTKPKQTKPGGGSKTTNPDPYEKRREQADKADPGRVIMELEMLSAARSALKSNPNQALAYVDQHNKDFPSSQLTDKFDEVRIKALCGLGRSAQAKTEAAAILKKRPGSLVGAAVKLCK